MKNDLKQPELFTTHIFENNPSSQIYLDENRAFFNSKCNTVYRWLTAGLQITVLWAANNKVSSLPRRVKDIRDKGFLISSRWHNNVKVYFMTPEQMEFNRDLFTLKLRS